MAKPKPLPAPYCPYCGKPAELIDSIEIYRQSYGMIWMCRPCDAYTGTHKSSARFAPLGTLANAKLRKLRQQVHQVFDPLHQSGKMTRSEAYQWLSEQLGIKKERCHVAMFDEPLCKTALRILNKPF